MQPKQIATKTFTAHIYTLGQRSFKNERGELLAWRFPTFKTRELALEYARNCNVTVIEDARG